MVKRVAKARTAQMMGTKNRRLCTRETSKTGCRLCFSTRASHPADTRNNTAQHMAFQSSRPHWESRPQNSKKLVKQTQISTAPDMSRGSGDLGGVSVCFKMPRDKKNARQANGNVDEKNGPPGKIAHDHPPRLPGRWSNRRPTTVPTMPRALPRSFTGKTSTTRAWEHAMIMAAPIP